MTTTDRPHPSAIDRRLMAFVFRAVDEVGATLNGALVVMGDKLGYYRALAGTARPPRPSSPSAPGPRAVRPRVAERAGGRRGSSTTTRRRAATPCPPSTPSPSPTRPARRSCPASSRSRSAPSRDAARVAEPPAAATGVGWHEHNHDVHHGCERFFRPGYHAHLVAEWLPALDGVVDEARARAPRSPTSAAATARRRC